MKRITSGFTMIEILIVVAVIGILATISILSYSKVQSDSRDSKRASSINVIAEGLEKYYDQNGEYPGCTAMMQPPTTVASTTLKGIDPNNFTAPTAAPGTNSITCSDISSGSGADVFAYVGDGSTTCASGQACLQFTLKYREESTGNIISVVSRRTTSILSSGNIADLSASPFSFSQMNLSWGAISGAVSYNIQYALNSTMTSPTAFTPAATTNSAQVTGLNLGTQYWFQVQPVSATGLTGAWSNVASATTYTLNTPTGTAVANPGSPASQIQYSWNSVPNATSYTVDYASDSSFTSPTTTTNATSPMNVTGLSAGTTLYFRVKAVAAGYTSGWSTTSSATTQVPAPSCTSSAVVSNTSITVSWGAVAVATHYNMQISTDSTFNAGGYIWDITGTSQNASGLNNATTYYFRVKALLGSTASTWAACPAATTGIDGPRSVGWSADAYGVRNSASVNWMPGAYPGAGNYWTNGMYIYGTCAPGATVVTRLYSYYAYSNNTTQNGGKLMDWTWGNQDMYMVGGNDSWKVWWQGWVACQVGGTRVGDTYLGNAGGY